MRTRFKELCAQAWGLSFSHPLLWLFGVILGIAAFAEQRILSKITASMPIDDMGSISATNALTVVDLGWIIVWLFVIFALKSLGKSQLIATLSFVHPPNNRPHYFFSPLKIISRFLKVVQIDGAFLLFLVSILIILIAPLGLAHRYNNAAIPILSIFSALTFLVITFVTFIIKELSLLYRLLAPLSFRSSLENGQLLFSGAAIHTTAFGLLSLTLQIFFTYCMDAIMLNGGFLISPFGVPRLVDALTGIIEFVTVTWFAIFLQALWYLYFRDIAETKQPEATPEELFFPKEAPDSPSV